jgi:glycosyltransferase involved in cell wall biosynthesis
MNKICIDARFWGIKHTGIGRYVENLIDHLPEKSVPQVELIISQQQENEPKLSKFKKHISYTHPYSLLSQLEIPLLLAHIRPKLLHVPHFTIPLLWKGPIVVTIHDLIKHISKGAETTTRAPWLYKIKHLGYIFIMRSAILNSRHIIVPAQYWKKEILSRYPVAETKISVIYESVDKDCFSENQSEDYTVPFSDPYIIYTGNLYPHKNIPVLLEAVKSLQGKVKLILVCSRSIFLERLENTIRETGTSPYVKVLNSVSDPVLNSLYQKALAFVTPSLIEGFGLPGLEAMAAGCPVISSNSSCLPEIYGNAVIYFNPRSSEELAGKILFLINHPEERNRLKTAGKKQIEKYSWSKMSQKTWEIYQQK